MAFQKRIPSVDAMKGLMIIIIVLHHFFCIPHFNHTYLPVDFFFFISGFFLLNSFEKNGGMTATEYTLGRIKKFYPAYIVTLLLCIIIWHDRLIFTNFDDAVEVVGGMFSLATMTHKLIPVLNTFGVFDVAWYMSVLIICGYLIYSILVYSRAFALMVLFPITLVVGISLLASSSASLSVDMSLNILPRSLLRGYCGMIGGALLCEFYRTKHDLIERNLPLINLLGGAAFVLFVCIMFTERNFDILAYVTLPFVVIMLMAHNSWVNKITETLAKHHLCLFSKWGKLSFEVLMIHQCCILLVFKALSVVKLSLPLIVTTLIVLIVTYLSAKGLQLLAAKLSQ